MEVMPLVACKRPQKNGERGQALLELLPVMLLLLILTFGVIDFGRAIWQLQVITGLTREGSNLASRNTSLADSAAAVNSDGAALNLTGTDSSGNGLGKVIITSVQNAGTATTPAFVITGQQSIGTFLAGSKVGTYTGVGIQTATLPPAPTTATTIPQPGNTIYVTEVYSSFSPITPIGQFVSFTMPSTLYDVAYY
jgi:Flp pilus assembly protein TadG